MKLCKQMIAGLLSIVLLLGAAGTPLAQTLMPMTQITVSAASDSLTADGFSYTLENDAVTINGYTGTATELEFPSEINGKPVTHIADYAFYENKTLRSVTIPDSVTKIGASAFERCHALNAVTIGTGVKYVGPYAFIDCIALGSITIPPNVTTIGEAAFGYRYEWVDVWHLGFEDEAVSSKYFTIYGYPGTTASAYAFDHLLAFVCMDPEVDPSERQEFLIDDVCYFVENGTATVFAFVGRYDPDDGRRVEIPSEIEGYPVTAIGDGAFLYPNCSSVVLPDSITKIGNYAFYAQREEPSEKNDWTRGYGTLCVEGGDNITDIGYRAFAYCNVDPIPEKTVHIGKEAFWYCNFKEVTIPDSVETIGESAFANCTSLTTVFIGKRANGIDKTTFSGCTALASLAVSSKNPNYCLLDGVLYNKPITKIVGCPLGLSGNYCIPDGVISIDSSFFKDFTGITSVTIPDSVETIGESGIVNKCAVESRPKIKYFFDCSVVAPFLRSGA